MNKGLYLFAVAAGLMLTFELRLCRLRHLAGQPYERRLEHSGQLDNGRPAQRTC